MPEQIKFSPDDARRAIFDDHELPSSDLPILDRTTLQEYAEADACPFRAVYLEQRLKGSQLPAIVTTGNEDHTAISKTLGEWCDNYMPADLREAWKFGDVRDALQRHVEESRPDVQPDAIRGLSPSIWSLAGLIAGTPGQAGIRPENILAFDGGEPWGKSGQLALDMAGVRVTSELDLLYAGPGSPHLLYEEDWKTGWKGHTAATVRNAFQFQEHAVLVFHKYPECQQLQVRVWDTRRNSRTAPVIFSREEESEYRARLSSAIGHRMQWIQGPKCWPSLEKCSGCPAASVCPEADSLIASEPEQLLAQLIATEARAESITKALKGIVKSTGKPVLNGTAAFGPKVSTRAPTVGVYAVAEESEAAGE